MRIRWSSGARQDLLDALEYIAADDPRAARSLLGRIRKVVLQIGRLPRSGRMIPEIGDPDLRERIVPPYRILYAVRTDVVILGVHHSRRLLSIVPRE